MERGVIPVDAHARAEIEQDNPAAMALGLIIDSQRDRLRRLIAEQGPFANVEAVVEAYVKADPRAGLPDRAPAFERFVGALWSFKKQGEVTFSVRQSGGTKGHGASSGAITKIKATPLLLSRLGIEKPTKDWPPRVLRTRRVTPVGRDGTNASTHPTIAPGGPVERRTVDRPIPEAGVITPDAAVIQPVGVDPTDHHNQPDETYEVPIEEVQPADSDGEDDHEWPILVAIRAKAGQAMKARQAVKLIEEAADLLPADERDRLINEAVNLIQHHDLTEIEEEYLRFAEVVDAVAG